MKVDPDILLSIGASSSSRGNGSWEARVSTTRLDPFTRTEARRLERELLDTSERTVDHVVGEVRSGVMAEADAGAILERPMAVRG